MTDKQFANDGKTIDHIADDGKKGFTDKEIIKALDDRMYCGKWIGKGFLDKKDFQILKNALDLINRQQAEIERLRKANDSICEAGGKLLHERRMIRQKAIKEFADRLKEHLKGNGGLFCVTTMNAKIDNLVKEMVGDDK